MRAGLHLSATSLMSSCDIFRQLESSFNVTRITLARKFADQILRLMIASSVG
jgi:hypothetical protein